jgi:hypothetical protein
MPTTTPWRLAAARALRPTAWRRVVARPGLSPLQGDLALSSSATINAQIWFSQFPLRPTAAWTVAAALLAAGWLMQPAVLDWREVALLLLLTDPLWGSLWRLAAGREELLPLRERDVPRAVWLPYLQAGSPAARLLGWDESGVLPLVLRVVFPTAALAFAIALVLGPTAVWLTGVVIVLGLVGWILRHSLGVIPATLHSAVTVALPWALTSAQMGAAHVEPDWNLLAALAALWTVHNWGEGRCLRAADDWLGIGLLGIADVGLAGLLIVAKAPLWLALMSVLWLPTWLLVYQRRPLQRLNFVWLLAMLVSALALGFRL